MKEWKKVISDRIWATKSSQQTHIFSHQVKKTCLLACLLSALEKFREERQMFYFTTLFITFVIQRRKQEKELGIWCGGGMRITGDMRSTSSDYTKTLNTTWTGLGQNLVLEGEILLNNCLRPNRAQNVQLSPVLEIPILLCFYENLCLFVQPQGMIHVRVKTLTFR